MASQMFDYMLAYLSHFGGIFFSIFSDTIIKV